MVRPTMGAGGSTLGMINAEAPTKWYQRDPGMMGLWLVGVGACEGSGFTSAFALWEAYGIPQHPAASYCILQCPAASHSIPEHPTAFHSILQHPSASHNISQQSIASHSIKQYPTASHSIP